MTESTKIQPLDDAALDAVAGGLPKPEAPHGSQRRSHGTVHDSHSTPEADYCQFTTNSCTTGPTMGQSYFSSGVAIKG